MSEWTAPLVLASASARRRALLETVGIPVETDPSDTDESFARGAPAATIVIEVARRKAAEVAARHPGRAVLAADTMVRVDGRWRIAAIRNMFLCAAQCRGVLPFSVRASTSPPARSNAFRLSGRL